MSAVQILYELFRKLQESGSPQEQPKPCDYFDLICGSEWGAVIALMLGRKKMTIDECILWLKENVFVHSPSFWQNTAANSFPASTRCREALRDLFKDESLLEPQETDSSLPENERAVENKKHKCNTMVVVTNLSGAHLPLRLRTYTSKMNGEAVTSTCSVFDAAMAAIAVPTRVPAVYIDAMPCVSALISGFANPALEALDEATCIWSSKEIYSVVSIGTGERPPKSMADVGKSSQYLIGIPSYRASLRVVNMMSHVVSDAERAASELFRYSRISNFSCFRFSVTHAISNSSKPQKWSPNAFEVIRQDATNYVNLPDQQNSLIACCNTLLYPTSARRINEAISSSLESSTKTQVTRDTFPVTPRTLTSGYGELITEHIEVEENVPENPGPKLFPAHSPQSVRSWGTDSSEVALFDTSTATTSHEQDAMTDKLIKNIQENTEKLFNDAPEDARKVKVAVLDTGIDATHEYIKKHWKRPILGARGCRLNDAGYLDFLTTPPSAEIVEDVFGHGTHVAGIILQLAPDAELYVARVFRSGSFDQNSEPGCAQRVAEAIRYAVDVWGVDIISMSFGFTIDVQEVFDAVIYAYSKNVLMIAAASNDGNSKLVPISYPARLLGLVICMNSTNAAGFPSRGNPPAALYRDNFSILGERVKSTWSKDANRDGVTVESDELWKRASGTSVATPVAAAVVSQIIYWKRVHWTDIQWHSKLESYGGIRQMLASMVTQKTSDGYQYILPSAVLDARVKSAISGTFTINLGLP